MHDSVLSATDRTTPERWQPVEVLPAHEAQEFARAARITRAAAREYMVAYLVSEETADREIRQLLERFLRTGRLGREHGGTTVRVRCHKSDGDSLDAYSFLVNFQAPCVINFRGPADSYFDIEHVPTDELLELLAIRAARQQREAETAQRRAAREEEDAQRQAAHQERMRQQEVEAALRRQAAAGLASWPLLPDGAYDRSGRAAALPRPRQPIADEARIRRVGQAPYVLCHSDALNSVYFRNVVPESRCEALGRVLDLLLRSPSKGTVVVEASKITVSGGKVVLTLSPDCAMVLTVRTANKMGKGQTPPGYRAKEWKAARPDSRPGRGDSMSGPAD